MKDFKAKLKCDFVEALHEILEEVLVNIEPTGDDDKIFLAGLAEVKGRLYIKLGKRKEQYTVSFSPVQALALRMLYNDVFRGQAPTYTTNRLRQIADEVHRHYS